MSKRRLPKGVERRGETSFRIRVFNGYDENGKKRSISRTISFPSGMTEAAMLRECEERRALLKAEIRSGQVIDAKQITVREFSERWMQEHVVPKLAQGTIDNNRGYLDRRILPALGHVKLHELTPYMITQFLNSLRAEGEHKNGGKLRSTSIRSYYDTLSAMLSKAVQWGLIAYSPMTRVDAPKRDTPPAKFYDDEQAAALRAALEDAPVKYKTAVYIALSCGARLGEVVGLKWGDIRENQLYIDRALTYSAFTGTVEKSTKSGKVRNLTLPRVALNALAEQRREQDALRDKMGDAWMEGDYIFTQKDGKPMHPDTPSKWWRDFLNEKQLPRITFHGLRHTHATLLLADNHNIESISRRLGHSRTSTTLNVYTHAIEKLDQEAAETIDKLFEDYY